MANNSLIEMVREIVRRTMEEMPGEGYVGERTLTPAEEKKKEELVKALKPKYGKTPKTYAIATAQAKKLAEDFEEESDFEEVIPSDKYDSQVISPRDGINSSNKYLAIVFKNDEVDDNKYFDSEEEAQGWCDDCCNRSMNEKLDFTDKYDDNPNLKGKQSELPDELQKGIINKKLKKEEMEEEGVEEEGLGISFPNKTAVGRRGHEDLPYHARGAKK